MAGASSHRSAWSIALGLVETCRRGTHRSTATRGSESIATRATPSLRLGQREVTTSSAFPEAAASHVTFCHATGRASLLATYLLGSDDFGHTLGDVD